MIELAICELFMVSPRTNTTSGSNSDIAAWNDLSICHSLHTGDKPELQLSETFKAYADTHQLDSRQWSGLSELLVHNVKKSPQRVLRIVTSQQVSEWVVS